jgi:hypothetical protein
MSGFEALLRSLAEVPALACICAMVPEDVRTILVWFDLTIDPRWTGTVSIALDWRLFDVCLWEGVFLSFAIHNGALNDLEQLSVNRVLF